MRREERTRSAVLKAWAGKTGRVAPIILATYTVLALKWYPGTVDGRFCFEEPLRIVAYGLADEFPNPGHVTVCKRAAWPLVLAIPMWGASYLLLRLAGSVAIPFLWRNLRRTFRPQRGFVHVSLRAAFAVATLNMLASPINRAIHRPLPTETAHDIITYGLFPVSLAAYLLYSLCCSFLRVVAYFFNPWMVPSKEPPNPYHHSSVFRPYEYEGLVVEVFRFLLLAVLVAALVGVLSSGADRYPRVARVIIGCLCVCLAVVLAIGIVSPAYLR